MNNHTSFTTPSGCGHIPACIQFKAPSCPPTAIIPAITVETTEGLTNLSDCFVHVTSNNTTYYVDDRHRPMLIWAGVVEVEDYDLDNNPLNLRSQFCVTTVEGRLELVYFNKQGQALLREEDNEL